LQVGDSFQLFSANNFTGNFATIIYPDGYLFTNTLAADGRIWVAATAPNTGPNFPSGSLAKLPDGNLSITATGTLGAAYSLWASTNVTLTPVTNTWTLLTNGTVGNSPFTIIDNVATNFPRRFYLFTAP